MKSDALIFKTMILTFTKCTYFFFAVIFIAGASGRRHLTKKSKKSTKDAPPDEDNNPQVELSPFDITYPTTCSNLKQAYDGSKCQATEPNALKTAVLNTPSCTAFAEDEVPLRLGIPSSKCLIIPEGQKCYNPESYSFGTKTSQCRSASDKTPFDYAANAGTAYPPRRSLSEDTLEQFCWASSCIDGLDGPLIPPTVFEHLVEISSQCLLTPVQLNTLTQLGVEWDGLRVQLTSVNFGSQGGNREHKGGSGIFQIFQYFKPLTNNKRYNQLAIYTYFQAVYTTIVFEFVGMQGYQEALLDSDNYLGSGFKQEEKDSMRGQPTSFLLWKRLQKEKVYRCYALDGTDEYGPVQQLGSSNKPYKIWPNSSEPDTYICQDEPRATEQEILSAVRQLVAISTNFQLFGGVDIQSFIPDDKLPDVGDIRERTSRLCAGDDLAFDGLYPIDQVCVLRLSFCPLDEQVDLSGLSNRQLLSVVESPYFAGSDEWRGFFNLDAMAAFNATQASVFYPECYAIFTDSDVETYFNATPCPSGSTGLNCCLNWKRVKVSLPNALETGVFGMPLRKYDQSSPAAGWKMVEGSSNFDLSVPPFQSLSLAEYCTALAENRFKGTVRGTRASSINREDNTLCNYRYALLVDFFQDLEINPFVSYLGNVTSSQDRNPF